MIQRLLRLVGRWARKPVNHTSWVALVTPTDRPKSVRNRCLIELFCGVVCVVTLPFWHFCWCRGFCHRTESDLFPFSHRMPCLILSSWIFRTLGWVSSNVLKLCFPLEDYVDIMWTNIEAIPSKLMIISQVRRDQSH